MRSRSNRLFVVLLHLVGCPQHFHNTFEGIVGVQPWPMFLETVTEPLPEPVWLQDEATQTCLGPQGTFTPDCGDATLWLAVKQRLAVPRSRRRRRHSYKRNRARMGLWAIDEEDETEWLGEQQTHVEEGMAGYGDSLTAAPQDTLTDEEEEGLVFYLVDRDVQEILDLTSNAHSQWWKRLQRWNPLSRFSSKSNNNIQSSRLPLECLAYDEQGNISIEICDNRNHKIPRTAALPNWGWRMDDHDASLRPARQSSSLHNPLQPPQQQKQPSFTSGESLDHDDKKGSDSALCATLTHDSARHSNVRLSPCQSPQEGDDIMETTREAGSQVELTLVRYLTAQHQQPNLEEQKVQTDVIEVGTAMEGCQDHTPSESMHDETDMNHVDSTTTTISPQRATTENPENAGMAPVGQGCETTNTASSSSPLFRPRDLAHMAALDLSMHPELPPRPRLLFEQHIVLGSHIGGKNKNDTTTTTSNSKNRDKLSTNNSPLKKKQPRMTALHHASPFLLVGGAAQSQVKHSDPFSVDAISKLSSAPANVMDTGSLHHRKRRIPVHPQIATSKNEVWTDPQTGLEYPTDLSGYLGHDRKERGRHTIMGAGLYRKYVIKVYGIAYYVSKRDVLTDPFFERYADMSPDELRRHSEFYDHLRSHPENFERSLFIKTNMQLSSQAIRSSLQADWTMLTDEAKDLIMESSMRPLPVDERTLAIIQDPNNPSKCSCESIAPPEYQADPTCCARGTELVFTWLKNGDLEVSRNTICCS